MEDMILEIVNSYDYDLDVKKEIDELTSKIKGSKEDATFNLNFTKTLGSFNSKEELIKTISDKIIKYKI